MKQKSKEVLLQSKGYEADEQDFLAPEQRNEA
jgi:hypothetical protein